ncbi:hypothetical protein ATCC90586_004551 [Pythium insidiosum]|nr:hypothetical protein ATCC90586_004551 [Pythium insidiosum]
MTMTTTSCDGDALLLRLRHVFQQDPAIDEIGLIFGLEIDELTLDNAFVLADHKLGVAFCAGPLIFRAARTRFHALRSASDSKNVDELLLCTRAILLICADFYTAWNARKELVTSGVLSVADEIAFCNLVLSLHAKSIDTWAYRYGLWWR